MQDDGELKIVDGGVEERLLASPAQALFGTSADVTRCCGMDNKTYNRASEVVAEDGRVLVDGPDHVDVALTPDAALETGGRLIDEAAKAAGQFRGQKQDEELRRPR